jgi:hypothetical protein
MMRSLRIEIRHRYRLKKHRKILNGGGLDWFPARRAAPGPRNAWRNRPAGAVPPPMTTVASGAGSGRKRRLGLIAQGQSAGVTVKSLK